MAKKISVIYAVLIILISGLIFSAAFNFTVNASNILSFLSISSNSSSSSNTLFFSENNKLYVNLNNIILAEGYHLSDKTENNIAYKKNKTSVLPEIVIRFNLQTNTAYKNRFRFDIKDSIKLKSGIVYIEKEKLENILNININTINSGNSLKIEPLVFAPHDWIKMGNGLVAHAGGSFRDINPPNCLETVIYSYQNGHRVFELDFNLTADGKLAAVHDWSGYKGIKSSDEWKKIKIWDAYTSIMLEDVLDIMIVNKDMFLITDTKSFEYTQKQVEEQFRIIVSAAKHKDPSLELLDRIIPQIYNQSMYDTVMKAYNFKSIIYTLYESPDTNEQVVSFIKKHDNIQAVTMNPARNRDDLGKNISNSGRYVYYHTLNDLTELISYKKSGVWGFYTNFIFPQDITPEAIYSAAKISVKGKNGGEIKNTTLSAYNIKGKNYFKICDLAYVLNGTEKQFEIVWNEKNNMLSLTSGRAYTVKGGETSLRSAGTTTASLSMAEIYLNGKKISTAAYNIGGENYFRLRDIGKTLNFNVSFDSAQNTILINIFERYSDD